MKVLSIDSPYRLKDRTVEAIITVAEDDMIPLIMLADRAYKGEEISIDIASGERCTEDTPLSIIMDTIIDASMAVIESQLNIAKRLGYQEAMKDMDDETILKGGVDESKNYHI